MRTVLVVVLVLVLAGAIYFGVVARPAGAAGMAPPLGQGADPNAPPAPPPIAVAPAAGANASTARPGDQRGLVGKPARAEATAATSAALVSAPAAVPSPPPPVPPAARWKCQDVKCITGKGGRTCACRDKGYEGLAVNASGYVN